MAYIVTRNNRSGYVSFVEKKRIPVAGGKTAVRNVDYVCGLGVMTQSEFEEFRDWAHGITHQESRKEAVLACPRVVEREEERKAKVAAAQQEKTTVKRAKRVKKVKIDDEEKIRAKAEEREKFRKEYEETKGIKVEKVKKVVRIDGIRFTGRQTLDEKRKILTERISQLEIHIANAKSDIRRWSKGTAARWKIPDAKEAIAEYEGGVKILKKQRAELRR